MADGKGCAMVEIPKDLIRKLGISLIKGEGEEAEALTFQILDQGVEPQDIVQTILVPTLTGVGERFQNFEIFLPELMMAGEAALRVTTIVEEATLSTGKASTHEGKVVIGQVEGDMHDIGRNIVRTMLSAHGFKVLDLGRDVAASAFLEASKREKADIVALSALMTTTLPAQRRTIALFREVGERGNFKIIVGGGPVRQEWADEIGADGYAPNAASAVELCKRLIHE
jgi:5-methyltetrahydrofolate--homocysteine methyltransferase